MELFKIFGKIAIDNSEANSSLDETKDKAEGAASKLGSAVTKIGGATAKIGGAIAVGVGAAATGIGVLAKAAVGAYADYEQLVGGVETLFGAGGQSIEEYAASVGKTVDEVKDQYDKLIKAESNVMDHANEAYKTAGLSANEYMETVTSFSAALISSLGGDTVKAAEVADKAIVDMSDNANKMGSSMESIQNAYQGFAKQNYTMLDNLKLGYGGTKEEMQRLLDDAGKLTNQKFDLSSYADIVEAIHVVQENMGIAGTTSEEAATTIQGSVGMMKAAWQNFLTGMSDPEQDFGALVGNLVDSVVIAVDNIVPRIIETVPRLVEGLGQIVENLIPHIGPMIEKLLPSLLQGAVNLIAYLVQNLPSLIMSLGTALWNSLQSIFTEISSMLPAEAQGAFSAITDAFRGVWEFCLTVWDSIGKPIFDLLMDTVAITSEWFTENFGDIGTIVQDTFSGISAFWDEHLKPCFEAIGNFIKTVLAPVFETVFKNLILPIVSDTFKAIGNFWNNVLKPVFTGIIDFITGVFSGNWKKAFQGIVQVAKGILNGIVAIFKTPFEKAKSIVKNAINFIRSLFNFEWHLPQLKLPHFSINGSFSLNPPSVPSFGIEWYKKGGVMTDPTAFGFNPFSGKTMIGGEAGDEAIAPIETLKEYIREAVSENDVGVVKVITDGFEKLLVFLQQYIPEMTNMRLVLDSGALVGELAPGMDTALGKLADRDGRGG